MKGVFPMTMERTMHRQDRSLPQEECLELLKQGTHGILSVVGDEGWPYAVPMNYVELNGCLYLHCAKAGYKTDAITRDERVCFTVVTRADVLPTQITTVYESVIVLGRATIVEDPEERLAALDQFIDVLCQVTPELHARYIEKLGPKASVIRITPEQITGKANRKPSPVEQRAK